MSNYIINSYFNAAASASGGTEITVGSTKYHKFTSSGTLTITGGTLELMVIMGAGAGGAGGETAGGSGAGGIIYQTGRFLTSGSYAFVMGNGGASACGRNQGVNGQDSTFDGLTCKGGGYSGAKGAVYGSDGGSGGGGGNGSGTGTGSPSQTAGTQPSQAGDSGTYGFGNGSLPVSGATMSGEGKGGGGAGSSPANAANALNQNVGGRGLGGTFETAINTILIDTSLGVEDPDNSGQWYIGGGGSGTGDYNQKAALGSNGVGGTGQPSGQGGSGGANTSAGGGGGSGAGNCGGTGGSGFLVVSYTI